MNDLKDIWSTVSFAGSPFRVDNIKSWEPETKELFQDYKHVQEFLKKGKDSTNSYLKELKFLLDHCERKKYFLRFFPCSKKECECKGMEHDIKKPMNLLHEYCETNSFFEPRFYFKDSILSNNQNGRHFTTFFDYINNGKTLQ